MQIVVMRDHVPNPALRDDWNRPIRSVPTGDDPPEHLRTIGDLQPRAVRGGTGEQPASHGAGTAFGSYVAFTDVVDILTGDTLRTLPKGIAAEAEAAADDGLRYNVVRVDRPGVGRHLDHLEVGCDLVTSGVPGEAPGSGS
jgi:hypothetical protein